MDRDTFIITMYCLVEEHYRHLTAVCPIRHSGFLPQLCDVEVITMLICGEFFKLSRDTDLFAYFRAHYRSFFPALTDRTLFVRQAAKPLATPSHDPAAPGADEPACHRPGPGD